MLSMIPTVISFFLGTTSLRFFSVLPSTGICASIVLLLALLTLMNARHVQPKYILYFILIFSCGFLWALWNAKMVYDKKLPYDLQKKPIEIIGVVDSIPDLKNHTQHFTIKIKRTIPETIWPNPGHIKLRWYDGPEDLHVGEVWRFTVKLKRPRSYSNPGSFDTEQYAFQNRIVAEGTVVDKLPPHKINNFEWRYSIDRVRSWFRDQIQYHLEGRPFAGIITALLVGITNGISLEQWEVFRKTGTAHLVAISGLHIGLVSGFVYSMIRILWRSVVLKFLSFNFLKKPAFRFLRECIFKTPASQIAAILSCFSAILYAFLAGFSIPTQRAVIMISLFILSTCMRRIIPVWRSYCLALGLVTICDPLCSLMPGFWLSFAAVGILLYGMQGRYKTKGIWWQWGRAQWVVFLGLTPVTLAMFNTASWVSPAANIISIPWVSFVVVPLGLLGLIGAFASPFSLIGGDRLSFYGFSLAEKGLAIGWPYLKAFSEHPKASWVSVNHTSIPLALMVIGILLWLAPRGLPGRWLGIIGILPFFLIKTPRIEKNTVQFTLLDVGQGLSAIIETENHVLVFDTGPKLSANFNTGDRVVLPFLAFRGYQSIDMLMISHGDNDHAGGVSSILKQMPVKSMITSEPELYSGMRNINVSKTKELEISLCFAGKTWEWDGVQFEILHPTFLNTPKRNDHSCVLQVRNGEHSILLTADIEAVSEKEILKRAQHSTYPLKSTIMVVPHHGSRTSSTEDFIRAVDPKYAVIPAGYLNSYGHPKPDIVERYRALGIEVLDTIHDGAISFILRNKQNKYDVYESVQKSSYRLENTRFWQYSEQ